MKRTPRLGITIGIVVLLVVAAGAWWRFGSAKDDSTDGKAAATAPGPVAQVRVSPARRGEITRTLTAFGTAVAASGGSQSVQFPFECRVVSVQANVGQPVAAGDVLLRIEPSADARLALDTARSAREAAGRSLKDVQSRFKSHLATNQDLAAAEAAARDANLKLESLQGRGPGADGLVHAPAAGVVTKITAQPGAVVAAGGPLAEVAVENRFEARLGVEPPDAVELKLGQPAQLAPVEPRRGGGAEQPIGGTVRVVGQSVDPATRLVDVFVALDDPKPDEKMLIGTYLRAEIIVEKKEALLVPRAAALPEAEGDQAVLFTVRSGHAVKHTVRIGIDDGKDVEVLPAPDDVDLKDGAPVVTQGNYELEDGMAVEIERPGQAAAGEAPTP